MAVSVGSQDLLKDMLQSCTPAGPRKTVQVRKPPEVKFDPRIVEKNRLAKEKAARDVDLMRKAISRRVQEKNITRDRREADRLAQIEHRQNTMVAEMDEFLRIQHGKWHNQKKELHNIWTEQVYQKIQKQIASQVGDIDSVALNERLNELFQKYIETADSKMVFRDIIIESEYDPMENKTYTVKVDAKPRGPDCWDGIVDPLNEQIEKVMEIHTGEGRQLPISHQSKCPGKNTLPVQEWLSGVIEATPHGFAAKLFDKELADADLSDEMKAKRAARNKSMLNDGIMDHYDFPRTREAYLAEVPKGKKCFPGWQPTGSNGGANPLLPDD